MSYDGSYIRILPLNTLLLLCFSKGIRIRMLFSLVFSRKSGILSINIIVTIGPNRYSSCLFFILFEYKIWLDKSIKMKESIISIQNMSCPSTGDFQLELSIFSLKFSLWSPLSRSSLFLLMVSSTFSILVCLLNLLFKICLICLYSHSNTLSYSCSFHF